MGRQLRRSTRPEALGTEEGAALATAVGAAVGNGAAVTAALAAAEAGGSGGTIAVCGRGRRGLRAAGEEEEGGERQNSEIERRFIVDPISREVGGRAPAGGAQNLWSSTYPPQDVTIQQVGIPSRSA